MTSLPARSPAQQSLQLIALRLDNQISLYPRTSLAVAGEGGGRSQAMRETLQLLHAGIMHLCHGAPGQAQGQFGEAVARASLRNAPLAAMLGLTPPRFETLLHVADYTTGHEEARFYARRLTEAASHDAIASRQMIADALQDHAPAPGMDEALAAVLKKEAENFLPLLCAAYTENCAWLLHTLDTLPPPAPPRKKPQPKR